MDNYQPNGRGLKQIRQAMKIVGQIEAANGSLTLDDADLEVLRAAVDNCQWIPIVARQLGTFFDAVEKAEDVKA